MKTKLRTILPTLLLFISISLHAGAPAHGKSRLRELAVFPGTEVSFNYTINSQGFEWIIDNGVHRESEAKLLKEQLKESPGDIARLLRLQFLLSLGEDTNECERIGAKAEGLCRDRLAGDATNGFLLAELGQALLGLDKIEESTASFRKSTQYSPNDWRCWAGLGDAVTTAMAKQMNKEIDGQTNASAGSENGGEPHYHFSTSAITQYAESKKEAAACFEKAVNLASNTPDVYVIQGGSAWSFNSFLQYLHFGERSDNSATGDKLRLNLLSDTISYYRSAAERATNNPMLIAFGVTAELIEYVNTHPNHSGPKDFPEQSILRLKNSINRIKSIAENSHGASAADAWEACSGLNYYLNDFDGMKSTAEKSLSMDPQRELAWDMLFMAPAMKEGATGTYSSAALEEMASTCERRLKVKNSEKTHLLLSKVYRKQEKWDKARTEAETALSINTNSLPALLSLLAMDIRGSSEGNGLELAGTRLNQAGQLIQNLSPGDEKEKQMKVLLLNYAIILAVSEGDKQADPKEIVRTILKKFPNDQDAKNILQALD